MNMLAIFDKNNAYFHQILLLVLILFFAVLQYFFQFSLHTQIIFFLGLTLTIGMFHGLLDVILLKHDFANKPYKNSTLTIIYGALTLATIGFFTLFHGIALITLLLLSVWHFGEAQRDDDLTEKNNLLKRFMIGANPLAAAYLLGSDDLQKILHLLIKSPFWLNATDFFWYALSIVWLVAVMLIFVAKSFQMPNSLRNNADWLTFAEIVVVWLAFKFLPLLAAFSLYFAGYHALRHIRDVLKDDLTLKLHKKSLIFVACLTLGLLALITFLLRSQMLDVLNFSVTDWLRATLILLLAVTLPHAILITIWRAKKLHKSL
jgi:beta-carotene 15,15'-dioxygenase